MMEQNVYSYYATISIRTIDTFKYYLSDFVQIDKRSNKTNHSLWSIRIRC